MPPALVFPESERELCDLLCDLDVRIPTSAETVGKAAAGPIVTGSAAPDPAAARAGFGEAAPGAEAPRAAVISTSRLADIVSFRPRDLTIEVGTGMRMKDLLHFVEEHNLWLPASGPGLERSVGGWVSAASPGAWDARFGPVRRQLLGCRMVTPAGQPLTWGRAVMKNVAGYDVPRLMAGSRGRLGVMTSVTLRLWPRPVAISAHEVAGGAEGEEFPEFQISPQQIPSELAGILDRVVAVERLREVRALKAFTRLSPVEVADNSAFVAPLSQKKLNWLPAVDTLMPITWPA